METMSTRGRVGLGVLEFMEANGARVFQRNLRMGAILGHRRDLLRHHEQILPLHHVLGLLEILVLVGSSEPWRHDVPAALFLHSRILIVSSIAPAEAIGQEAGEATGLGCRNFPPLVHP